MSHIHTLACIKQEQPGFAVEPLQMNCGFEPYPELTEEKLKDLGLHTLIDQWVGENVEFREDGSFRRRSDTGA